MDKALTSLEGFWALVEDVWTTGIFGVELGRVLTALGIFFVFLVLRKLFARFVIARLKSWAKRSKSAWDDEIINALEKPIAFVPVVMGVFFALEYLNLTGQFQVVATNIQRSLVVITIFWGFFNVVDPLSFLLHRLDAIFTKTMVEWLVKAIKGAILFVGAAGVLEIWGIQIGPILAGLGLFGVAVALGAQDLFKNLIAGVLILAERRFQQGDWIRVDGVVEGTVETIGFRSTRIRRFDLAPVHVPNSKLSDSAVTNFSAMTHRRIYWMIGVEYRTTVDQLRQIRDQIEAYILENEDFMPADQASTFVRVDSFNDSSIDIMIYCFTKTRAWGEWLMIKEAFAYRIKDIIEGSGSGFAFPSQSVYVESLPDDRPEAFVPPGSKKSMSEPAAEGAAS